MDNRQVYDRLWDAHREVDGCLYPIHKDDMGEFIRQIGTSLSLLPTWEESDTLNSVIDDEQDADSYMTILLQILDQVTKHTNYISCGDRVVVYFQFDRFTDHFINELPEAFSAMKGYYNANTELYLFGGVQ